MLCEKKPEAAASQEEVARKFKEMTGRGHHTTYYHPPLQKSSFDLPLWVQKLIYEEASESTLSEGEL
jgi:hypothetical protein